MKNIVSAKTAQELKEIGFPQPEFAFGQFWYAQNDSDLIVCTMQPHDEPIFRSCNDEYEAARRISIFAPTSTDILPPECFLCREISHKHSSGEVFVVYDRDTLKMICFHENPAEAAALAFKELKK